MIKAHGPSSPKAFLIADIPIADDYLKGYAIQGMQRVTLMKMMQSSGLNIENFWCTTLFKEKPNDSGQEYAKDKTNLKQIDKWMEQLCYEINELQPSLLITLGELAFSSLTGQKGIRQFRGSVLSTNHVLLGQNQKKVLPILGPYPYVYQDYTNRILGQLDFSKVNKHANDSPIPDNQFNIWIALNAESLRNFLNRVYHQSKCLVFDIESWAGIPTCISFCFDGLESVCIPFIYKDIHRDQRAMMMKMVAEVLASPIPKVNQNIKFDVKTLERFGFEVNNVVGDTMIAAGTLYCEFEKNLGFLTSIYTEFPYFKGEGKEFDPSKDSVQKLFLYNAKDSLATYQIYEKQMVEVKEKQVEFVYESLMKCLPTYKRMENNGIRIDAERKEKIIVKYETLYNSHEAIFKRLANRDEINVLSSAQMRELVFDELGYSRTQRGVNGSTEEESLELLIHYGKPTNCTQEAGVDILKEIINCRKLHKVIELVNLPLHPDGRFRGEFNLAGTETGRTSGGRTLDVKLIYEDGKWKQKRLGHSLQNLGKHGFQIDGVTYGQDIRSIFVPSVGYVFVEIDLSQAEARVDAILSGNFDILAVFDGPIGIHKLTGSWIYNCKPEEIKKRFLVNGVERYHTAKTARHACERNIGAYRLASILQTDLREADRVLKVMHKYQPEIREVYHRDIINAINSSSHSLRTPNGRIRQFFGKLTDGKAHNEGISFYPQAIVADQTKFCLPKIEEECKYVRYLMEAHDGVLCEVPKDKKEEYALHHKKNVETPIDFRKGTLVRDFVLTIPSEAEWSDESWEDMRRLEV